jgi:hypothetical protein
VASVLHEHSCAEIKEGEEREQGEEGEAQKAQEGAQPQPRLQQQQ